MAIEFNPYFTFNATAREAMEFYHSVFGGELNMMTFKEAGASPAPEFDDLIMHARLVTDRFNLYASDGAAMSRTEGPVKPNVEGAIMGSAADADTATAWFEGLKDGATKVYDMNTAPWGATFGSLTDKFGISWMFNFGDE